MSPIDRPALACEISEHPADQDQLPFAPPAALLYGQPPLHQGQRPFPEPERASACGFVHRLALGAYLRRALARSDLPGDERAADDQLCQGGGDPAAGFEVGLDVLLHGERDIGRAAGQAAGRAGARCQRRRNAL
jgi:hypothetical protein